MLFARLVLIIQLLVLLGLGLAYFVRPHEMVNYSGMLLMSTAAATDVRAFYGGMQIGLAAFIGLSLTSAQLMRAALILLVLIDSSLALARIGGLWLDGGAQQTFNLYALVLEITGAVFSYLALRGLIRSQ
ncbi:DUF4345 family protein [Pseudomonas sp. TTU2014-080ASC]|uniref:DUF4345 family protein n=1 Tax=Pseudomonas sp. TTU2014-080ASC TaxID=1729724 RepID=UPI0007183C24|nr:DUF4345 family protein [Pseudomonas sp. TTU2014-080ASC]KRW62879.1 hypothetical protein AO726_05545 [Pseudomonas sp. TTU2014-080ASC]